jgi:hypothetical protein
MEVNVQLKAPAALPLREEPQVLIGLQAGWAAKSFWKLWRKEEKILCCW